MIEETMSALEDAHDKFKYHGRYKTALEIKDLFESLDLPGAALALDERLAKEYNKGYEEGENDGRSEVEEERDELEDKFKSLAREVFELISSNERNKIVIATEILKEFLNE